MAKTAAVVSILDFWRENSFTFEKVWITYTMKLFELFSNINELNWEI